MYIDQMVYRIGDMVRLAFPPTAKHNIGLIVSINENATIYGVKIGNYTKHYHYSFIQAIKEA